MSILGLRFSVKKITLLKIMYRKAGRLIFHISNQLHCFFKFSKCIPECICLGIISISIEFNITNFNVKYFLKTVMCRATGSC